jgi:hypothetical protein
MDKLIGRERCRVDASELEILFFDRRLVVGDAVADIASLGTEEDVED